MKKGQSVDDLWEKIFSIFFMMAVFLATYFLITSFIQDKADTKQVEAEVFFNKMMYSPDLFWHKDEIGISSPGVLVLSNFSDQTLNDWISYDPETYLAAELTLEGPDGEIVSSAFFNKKWYERWAPLAEARILGLGSTTMYKKWVPVTYIDEGERIAGMLEVRIVVPHR